MIVVSFYLLAIVVYCLLVVVDLLCYVVGTMSLSSHFSDLSHFFTSQCCSDLAEAGPAGRALGT